MFPDGTWKGDYDKEGNYLGFGKGQKYWDRLRRKREKDEDELPSSGPHTPVEYTQDEIDKYVYQGLMYPDGTWREDYDAYGRYLGFGKGQKYWRRKRREYEEVKLR